MASLSTRSHAQIIKKDTVDAVSASDVEPSNSMKRSAENSPEKVTKKRNVLGDVTNAVAAKKSQLQIVKTKVEKKLTRKTRNETNKEKNTAKNTDASDYSMISSQGSTNVDSTPFLSALDTSALSSGNSQKSPKPAQIPDDVEDFDAKTIKDPFAEPHYAMDIFNYYKKRENMFKLDKYIDRQPELSKGMRAILADWLVEVQESFELNHETLYMALKLVDHYLMRNTVSKASLQLLGATAVFIASKFDERSPPLIDDFLYICDDAYSRKELILLEIRVVKSLNFDLGIPISYRFLRRIARCAKLSMEVLTLARFILETSLMEYDLITEKDSKVASAALLLALRMKQTPEWTSTLQYYSGYKEEELSRLVIELNQLIALPSFKNLKTIRTKYSHKIFFEVAKTPPLPLEGSSESASLKES